MKSSKLAEEEVKHIAKLANLPLTEAEIEKFQKQLSDVLEYFGILNQAETEEVEPTSQVTGLKNVWREDQKGQCLSQEEALSGSKAKKEKLFKVKAIFEE